MELVYVIKIGVVDKSFALYPVVPSSTPDFTSLSDETLSRGRMRITFGCVSGYSQPTRLSTGTVTQKFFF